MTVTWWKWYGPREGPGSVDDVVSHTIPVAKALKSHSTDIAFHASALLNLRSDERTGDAQIVVRHRGQVIDEDGTKSLLDSYVLLVDPLGKGGAKGIEFGFDRTGVRKDGTKWSQSVDGKYVLTDAISQALKGG